jgi:hypothetical protein
VNATAAPHRHATIEELLEASFSMRSVSYQKEICDYFFPELLVVYLFSFFPFPFLPSYKPVRYDF